MNSNTDFSGLIGLDFGAGSCVAECNHCVFGVGHKKTSISQTQLAMYDRIRKYAEKYNVLLSLGFLEPVERLEPEVFSYPFQADSLRVSTRDPQVYFSNPDFFEKLKPALEKSLRMGGGITLSVHAKRLQDIKLSQKLAWEIVEFQLRSITKLPTGTLPSFTIRINRTDESIKAFGDRMLEFGFMYSFVMKKCFPDFELKLSLKKDSYYASLVVTVTHKKRTFIFGIRFINTEYRKEESELADLEQRESGNYGLALFPDEVHTFHTTMNINDRTLRFSYEEFEELLIESEKGKTSLLSVISKRVDERRAKKVIKLVTV